MLDEAQLKSLFSKIYKLSPARLTEATLRYRDVAVTRFANNRIIQNTAEEDTAISVRVLCDNRIGRAATNRFDDASLARCCDVANQLAKNAAPDPDALPFPGQQTYSSTNPFFDATRFVSAYQRAEGAQEMIEVGIGAGANMAGINKTATYVEAIGNSQGIFVADRRTHATASVTAMLNAGSGFAIHDENDVRKLEYELISRQAVEIAENAQHPRELPPGEYRVILTPQAVANLLTFLVCDYINQISNFSGTAYAHGQGFVAGHLGDKVFGENFSLDDDAYHPLQQGVPFDGEGMPRKKVTLIKGGVITELVHSRASALQLGAEPTGHGLELPNPYGAMPQNLVLHGGEHSLSDLMRLVDDGVLVSRFWYSRVVDPNKVSITGMTRDGTFLIKEGKIHSAIKNLRFNESLLRAFNRIIALGTPVRTYEEETGQIMVVPPVALDGFQFTNVTLF